MAEPAVDLTAERVAHNDATFRRANEVIRAAAEEHDVSEGIAFVCECANPDCRELIRIKLDEYREVRSDPRTFLNVPGHHVFAHGHARVISEHDGYVIAEKIGLAGEIVEHDARHGGA